MAKRYLSSRRIWFITSLIILDILFFFLADPDSINSALLIVGFILLSLTFFALVELLLHFLNIGGIKLKHRKKLAMFLAIVFGVLLALQSIGQLSFRDVIVIVPLGILFYVYLTYVRTKTNA